VTSTRTSFVIDQKGRILFRHQTFRPAEIEKIGAEVEAVLARPAATGR